MARLVIGIDPGTGSSSAAGFVAFIPAERRIVRAEAIWPQLPKLTTFGRIKEICERIEVLYGDACFAAGVTSAETLIGCEDFVIQGKGGVTLQRFIGATLSRFPFDATQRFCQNTSVKRVVGSAGGKSDKREVSHGVLAYFAAHEPSRKIIADAVARLDFDLVDAAAIGIAAWQGETGEGIK